MVAIKYLCPQSILLDSGLIVRHGSSSEVVNFYLTNVNKEQTSYQEFSGNLNKSIQIRKVAIRDDQGALTGSVDLNKDFIIQMDYEIREGMRNISIGCQIMADENNECVISLSDPELEMSRLDQREPGYYQSTVMIPAKILNTGSYSVRVGASNRYQVFDVVENTRFTVVDNVGIVQFLGYERKGSMLSMQLPWQVIRLETLPDHFP
jgi:lipopolysaccharide transport system ATP-binding protein